MINAKKYWPLIVNTQLTVNREAKYCLDRDQYGHTDFWAILGEDKLGDCEDVALTKREILGQELPHEALRLATCWVKNEGYHAVLIVVTDRGDYVLDNREKWPVPWEWPKYKWHKMQDHLGVWRDVL